MRFALALFVCAAACTSNAVDDVALPAIDMAAPVFPPDLTPAADCPTGMNAPTYCFSGPEGTASTCGACTHVGESCDYFEASLVCACDHQWRCSYAGGVTHGCASPDGGVVCN